MGIDRPTNYLTGRILNFTNSFFTHLCLNTGKGLIECEELEACETSNKMERVLDRTRLYTVIGSGKIAICYLAISEDKKSNEVYTLSDVDENGTLSPYVIVGWSDYKYAKAISGTGAVKRYRGYMIVCPSDKEMDKENFHYIPYTQFDIGEDAVLVKEVWSVQDADKDIIEARIPDFEYYIGENFLSYKGVRTPIPTGAFYHNYGNPLIPLREFAETLGYKVTWTRHKRRIDLTSHRHHIQVFIDKYECNVDGEIVHINFPATVHKCSKRTYINLSFIKKVFEMDAVFNKNKEKIRIYSK